LTKALAKLGRVERRVSLTAVGSQMEAEMICAMLRANNIQATERSVDPLGPVYGSGGGLYEVLVATSDLKAARKLLAKR